MGSDHGKNRHQPLQPQPPDTISWYYADIASGKIFNENCPVPEKTLLPFIRDGLLPEVLQCRQQPTKNSKTNKSNELEKTLQKGLKSIFDFLQ